MKMLKIVGPICGGLLVGLGSNYYFSNELEDKIKLSMEQHNKDAIVKFSGEPVVDIIMGTFEMKNFSMKTDTHSQVENSNLKFSGINYHNYFRDLNLLSDNIKVELKNVYTSEKVYSNHLIEIKSKGSDIMLNAESTSFDSTNKNKAMNQKFNLELKGTGDLYSFLTNEISKNIIKKEELNQSALQSKLEEISKTVIIDSANYKIVNNNLMQDIIYENIVKVYPDVKNKENMNTLLSGQIDNNYNFINTEYKAVIKDLLISENSSLTASVKNKTGIKIQDLAMQAVMSKNIEIKIKEHYTIEVKK
jgi:hypothetical protein